MSEILSAISQSLADLLAPGLAAFGPEGRSDVAALAVALLGLVLLAGLIVLRRTRRRAAARAAEAERERILAVREAESRAADTRAREAMAAELAEMKGRLGAMAEMAAARQSELAETLQQRLDHAETRLGNGLDTVSERLGRSLDAVTERLGANLAETGRALGTSLADANQRTADSLSRLYERLALIDEAGASIGRLTDQVVSLKDVLANKQMRGAFGQMRMEAIIEDGLPRGTYEFQATLSNGKRPDCLVRLPGTPAALVIDAKFPLEGFEALRKASDPAATAAASAAIREAIGRHIDDIAGKYLLPGETQDTALMFVPSEAVHGELNERFPDLVQKGHRARVVIVSPNMLMLAVQTMQAILKDVRMREQASLIQREVGHLMGDVQRLAERVHDLDRHFTLAARDVERITQASQKVLDRGRRIETVELEDEASATPAIEGRPARPGDGRDKGASEPSGTVEDAA
ncbi:MAG: DNA recombination protein RmuC [Hyphomicrobiaceae bacterium]